MWILANLMCMNANFMNHIKMEYISCIYICDISFATVFISNLICSGLLHKHFHIKKGTKFETVYFYFIFTNPGIVYMYINAKTS